MRRIICPLALVLAALVLGAAAAEAGATPSVVGSYAITDLGQGGWAGGPLYADGTLGGGGAVAFTHATRKPPIGRCTMALPATQSTIEVQIPDAADFCEIVSQALGYELFKAPMIVTPGRLWHYPGAALSCRLRYRHTSDRVRIHNADAACRWFLGLSPGWHLEAVAGPPHVRSPRGSRIP